MGSDLIETAEGNSHARRLAASERIEDDASGRLTQFRNFPENSTFATNVSLEKVIAFEQSDGVVDARTYFILVSGGDRDAGLAEFAESQGRHFGGRQNFEDLWEHGRRFVYGAVNGGGVGVEGFGPICLVLADVEAEAPDALGVFPEDTVKRYADAGGAVDGARALSEATAWEDRAELAVVERASEAAAAVEADWPPMLCSDGDYLEAVVTGPLPLRAVAQVRMPDPLRKRLDGLRAKALLNEAITHVERRELLAYEVLHAWRRRHRTAIERVPSR
jgi:hypothetical protein